MAKNKEIDEDDDLPQKRRRGDDEEGEPQEKPSFRERLEQIKERLMQAKDWAEKNQTKTMIILGGCVFVVLLLCGLYIWHLVAYYHRPTVEQALEALEFGAYTQAQIRARSVLRYAKTTEYEKRAVASYVLGVALLEQYELSNLPDKEPYYLMAANHLKDAHKLILPIQYRTRALLAYGKALYLSDSIPKAVEILLEAEGRPQQDNKTANWFLIHAMMRSEEPDYNLALSHCDKLLADESLTQMESYHGKLLRAHVLLKLGRLDEANYVFDQVPPLDELEAYQEFVCAQLLMEEGRVFRAKAMNLEKQLLITDPRSSNSEQDQEEQETPLSSPSVRKSAPVPPQYETETPRIVQAVVRRGQGAEQIVQMRRQSIPDTETPLVIRETHSSDTYRNGNIEDLRSLAIAKYREAILRLEMSKAADAADFKYIRQAYLLQGICFEEMGEFEKAKEQYRDLILTFPESDEAIAADIFRAEIFRKSGQFDLALTGHRRAIQKLLQKGVYQNPVLTRKEIVRRMSGAAGELMRLREYRDAFDLLAVYEPILPQREIARIKALGYESWAKMLQRNAQVAAFEEQEQLLRDAREKFRLSGQWYSVYAQHEITARNYTELLWRSAENYRLGKDYLQAIPVYRKYLKNEIRIRQAETLALLGQMYFELDLLDESIKIYDEYLNQYPHHPMLYQVRLIKSYAHREKQETEQAKTLLLENLSGTLAPQAAEYRDSIYALGKIYYDAGDREKAIATLEDAVYLHPDVPQTASAYYMIAQSYLKRVEEEQKLVQTANLATMREKATLEMQKARLSAHDNFQKTRKILGDRELVIPLSPAEQTMQMVCYFEIAKLELLLGRLNDALDSFNLAQNRFQERPETLDALIQTALIYRRLGKDEQAKETVQKGVVLLQKLTDNNAFPPGHRFNETEWNELLAWANH
ncbi:MAG: tetratricopeptide repeat protein [Planctomycetaceae bacterium]|nr:tetratricopeptide repeat protein [Planctomycetaceae bacterium]